MLITALLFSFVVIFAAATLSASVAWDFIEKRRRRVLDRRLQMAAAVPARFVPFR